MKIDVFAVSLYRRQILKVDEETGEKQYGPVHGHATVNAGAENPEDASSLASEAPDGFELTVTGVGNVLQGVLVADHEPPEVIKLEIKALQDENVALKAKIAEAHAELEKLHNPA